VNEPRKGVAIAKNTGVKSAKGDIIVFTDADTTHPIDWLKKVNKRFDDPKVACVFGALRPEDGDLIDQAVFFLSSDLLPAATYPLGFMIAHSPNLSFRRSVLVACGGYDERLIILEDNELPNRLKNRGKVVFDPKLWVFASARRFHNEGYMKPFIRFMKGYWSVYVSKEAQKCEYPEFR